MKIQDTRGGLMAFQTHKDLEKYQLSHDLAIEIHKKPQDFTRLTQEIIIILE
ncbi:MAG: hypothetical protein WAV32_06055 [Halobacteriota archaeon]